MNILTKTVPLIFTLLLFSCKNGLSPDLSASKTELFNQNWEFSKSTYVEADSSLFSKENNLQWEKIDLPHTANIEPEVIKGNQWQGICFYRKFFKINKSEKGKHIAIKFEGAMQVADIYLNGIKLKTNFGGYLPFYVDISKALDFEKENCLLVKLDNRDNAQVPPGKAISNLDFNIYSGIYRNVWLLIKDKVHITDPTEVDKIAGSGIFITFPQVSSDSAKIEVKVDVINESNDNVNTTLEAILLDKNGNIILKNNSSQNIQSQGSGIFKSVFNIKTPLLWSPEAPNLYTIQLFLLKDGKIVDHQKWDAGLRSISFTDTDGFVINGKKLKIRGTNRHQEYPYIGYALSDNANYRDAYKIKQAGFNFVRLSHYPHSESFISACDKLGIMVLDAIPGWQFFGDSVFQENSYSDVKRMLRRDRNHPSIIAWEASLNETGMSKEYMQKTNEIVHREFPGASVYTAGWIDQVYDLYIPARQHAKPPLYWNNYSKNIPFLIAEYGDWEYYAQNAGFNQKAFKDLSEEERNSRQLRAYGQKRLLQQALNFQEAHNSNLIGKAVGDANWLMFDYNRGYSPDIESSGIMDVFRLPKFSFYFYQSQAEPVIAGNTEFNNPMVFIANYYNDPSVLEIKVFSNCEQVELKLNGKTLEKRSPDKDKNSSNLKYAPFTFKLNDFIPGKLEAFGYINGKQVSTTSRMTPETPSSIELRIDESGKSLEKSCNDVVFLYASVVDSNGTIVPESTERITFSVQGDAELIGKNPIESEAGIASIILKAGKKGGTIKIQAQSEGLKTAELSLNIQ